MIYSINLNNFKCIPNMDFKFGRVNVFTGYNGRGKSSLLQVLLMMSQSIKKDQLNSIEKLHLNGDLVNLGDFDEILTNESKDSFSIIICLGNNGEQHKLKFEYKRANNDIKVGKMSSCIIDEDNYFDTLGGINSSSGNTSIEKNQIKTFPSYINRILGATNLHYVSADRRGPIKFVEKMEIPDIYKVGKDGIFTINTLSTYQDKISAEMNINGDDSQEYDLLTSTTRWVDFIMTGGKLSVKDGRNINEHRTSTISLEFNLDEKDTKRGFQSYNVGFGYSYILSIVVTALIAKEGNIVIIENPEAHLHPRAQLHMAYLLSKLASRGIQVFIETHSEHMVNGFRLAALKKEYKLSNEDINIFFFDHDYKIRALNIEPTGRIANWPEGFFDQYQKELAEIMILGSKYQ